MIAKDYIEQNGGKPGIESKEGEGSKFYFKCLLHRVREDVARSYGEHREDIILLMNLSVNSVSVPKIFIANKFCCTASLSHL